MIKNAIAQKLDSCQYEICKITPEQKKAIQNNRGSDCKERCKLDRLVIQSDSENAKCYCCHGRGLDGCVYQYTDNSSTAISGQCELKEDVPKEQCIGTSKDQACRQCVYNAYKAANLSDDQMICMSRTYEKPYRI